MKRIAALLLALALLLGISCGAEEAVPPVETEYNEADLAAYAACINGLAVRYGVPVILWDCSTHVNRASLSLNHPAYVEAIMACYPPCADPGNAGDDAVFEEESAREAADRFGPGFNLGNTLDATSYSLEQARRGEEGWIVKWGQKDAAGRVLPSAFETAWGQPLTTQAIADYIIGLGFRVIRIPVTWAEHLDAEDRIDPAWLARVREVVDCFHSRGVYCILNLHHDGGADGWIEASEASYAQFSPRFAAVWTQIAEAFADYDERLLFESMNEVLDAHNNWNAPGPEAAKWIDAWNQLFVDTVRATGGSNARRNLLVMTYSGGGAAENFDRFTLPRDSAEGHLMITVHNYDPQAFTWTNATWTRMTARWDGAVHGALLEREFQLYQRYAEQFGVPVVVGEYNADPKRYADYD